MLLIDCPFSLALPLQTFIVTKQVKQPVSTGSEDQPSGLNNFHSSFTLFFPLRLEELIGVRFSNQKEPVLFLLTFRFSSGESTHSFQISTLCQTSLLQTWKANVKIGISFPIEKSRKQTVLAQTQYFLFQNNRC